MAFTTPRTWTYGETVTEAQFNEQLRDNFNAVWVGTTAGDIDYYTSSTTKTRLAGGTANAGKFIRQAAGGTALEYASGGGITSRQGGGTTDWNTGGTTNYTITGNVVRVGGSRALTVPSGNSYSVTTTFQTPFSNIPLISVTVESITGDKKFIPFTSNLGTATFGCGLYNWGTSTIEANVHWFAEGEI